MAALVAVAARLGFTEDVTLPLWWGSWPRRAADPSGGWGALQLVLLGGLCGLWARLDGLLRGLRCDQESEEAGDPVPDRIVRSVAPRIAVLSVAWSLPLLLAAPMGSLDVQSYAAIGRLAAVGVDPYREGPGWLGDAFSAAVDPRWRWTPTPYGPLEVALLRGIVQLAGDHPGEAVLLIRGVAVLSAVAAGVLAVRAARPAARASVVLLTVTNPVVLIHVVGGAHLDVLVGGLAVLVVGQSRGGRPAVAMAFAVVACAVKLPGAVLVAFVVLDVVRRESGSARMGALARVSASGLAISAVVVASCRDPFGWLGALGVPGTTRDGAAPSTWMSYLLAAVSGHTSGAGLNVCFTLGRSIIAVIGVAVTCRLLWTATSGSRDAAFRACGWALLTVAVAGTAFYPWYLTWGLFAVAVGTGRRGRAALMVLSAVSCPTAVQIGGTASALFRVVLVLAVLGQCWRSGHGGASRKSRQAVS